MLNVVSFLQRYELILKRLQKGVLPNGDVPGGTHGESEQVMIF